MTVSPANFREWCDQMADTAEAMADNLTAVAHELRELRDVMGFALGVEPRVGQPELPLSGRHADAVGLRT